MRAVTNVQVDIGEDAVAVEEWGRVQPLAVYPHPVRSTFTVANAPAGSVGACQTRQGAWCLTGTGNRRCRVQTWCGATGEQNREAIPSGDALLREILFVLCSGFPDCHGLTVLQNSVPHLVVAGETCFMACLESRRFHLAGCSARAGKQPPQTTRVCYAWPTSEELQRPPEWMLAVDSVLIPLRVRAEENGAWQWSGTRNFSKQ